MARNRKPGDPTEVNLGFEDKLWAAADKLRGNMDAAPIPSVLPPEEHQAPRSRCASWVIACSGARPIPFLRNFLITISYDDLRSFYLAFCHFFIHPHVDPGINNRNCIKVIDGSKVVIRSHP